MMNRIYGKYFDGLSSSHTDAFLTYDGDRVQIVDSEGIPLKEFWIKDAVISPPLGRTNRVIKFRSDEKFETDEFDKVKEFESFKGDNRVLNIVDLFERKWKLALLSLIFMLAFVGWITVYGIPLGAKIAAFSLPNSIMDSVSEETMEILDKRVFSPTKLEKDKVEKYEKLWKSILNVNKTGDYRYKLVFRNSPAIGPNAFALPSGTIVVTDQLVKILKDDMELAGILAHEVGHVENRHGLRSVIQNTGVFLIVSILVGDVASITSMAATLPTLFINTGYSRQFEREADLYSAEYYTKIDKDNKPMRDILQRLTEKHPKSSKAGSFISTHPLTDDRIKFFTDYQKNRVPEK